jgi:hypothetical protein
MMISTEGAFLTLGNFADWHVKWIYCENRVMYLRERLLSEDLIFWTDAVQVPTSYWRGALGRLLSYTATEFMANC